MSGQPAITGWNWDKANDHAFLLSDLRTLVLYASATNINQLTGRHVRTVDGTSSVDNLDGRDAPLALCLHSAIYIPCSRFQDFRDVTKTKDYSTIKNAVRSVLWKER